MKRYYGILLATVLAAAPAWAEETQPVHQQFEGFNLSGYKDGGAKAWDVNGDTADVVDQTVKIKNVNANSYGAQDVNVKAKNGTMDKVSGNMKLEKDVVITSKDGTQMKTDTLDWHRNEDLVTTKDPVTITDQGMTVTGTGLTAHPNQKKAALNSDVRAQVDTPASATKPPQSVTITSDGPMEIDQAKQMAVFNQNVLAVDPVSDRELRADKMEVYFDDKSNQITKMICTGNVSVRQGANVSYAEKLLYDAGQQTMTLLGRPKLVFDLNNKMGSKSLFGKSGGEDGDKSNP